MTVVRQTQSPLPSGETGLPGLYLPVHHPAHKSEKVAADEVEARPVLT